MIDSATCNATDLAACPTTCPPPSMSGGDRRTSRWTRRPTPCTWPRRRAERLAVFDANTCNATAQSGCATLGYLTASDRAEPGAGRHRERHALHGQLRQHRVGVRSARLQRSDLTGCASDMSGTVIVPFPEPGSTTSLDRR